MTADEYADWDDQCDEVRRENAELLSEFCAWMADKGLSRKTIDKHSINASFYVDHFLLYAGITRPAEGVEDVGAFLGNWFIRKAMWSDESSIKENITSLKKFYTFMAETGRITREALDALKREIKEEKATWLERVRRYNNPGDGDIMDIFGFGDL